MGSGVLGHSIRMVDQFLHVRQGDNETMASRVTHKLKEQTASTVREQQLRHEYAVTVEQLHQKLSAQTTQQFQHFKQEPSILGQARLRTAEGVHQELRTAQK